MAYKTPQRYAECPDRGREPTTTYLLCQAGPICQGIKTNVSTPELAESEDCLFINVQAPTNATELSKLPVYLFIQGGGFSTNSNPNINGTGLIMAAKYGIVVVDFNYRVGPYGFLTDGNRVSTNNGLRDQRKAMEWVQKHIARFGGDPGRVVLGGVSAGAASISLHLTANNGTDLDLFHGVIAESPDFANLLTVPQSYYQYKQLATRLGCVGKQSLACLRNKTTAEIQAQNYNIPFPDGASPPTFQWEPCIDGEIVTDYTYRAFHRGKFLQVPAIFGDDSNGGTIFCPPNTSTLAQSNQFMLNSYPDLSLDDLADANDLYPNKNRACPGIGCYWRQLSTVYGEARYMCPALTITAAISRYGAARGVPSYAYRWNVEDPEQEAQGLGVPHTVEFNAVLGPAYAPPTSVPASYQVGGANALASPVIQGYWTSFVKTLDPNKLRFEGAAEWNTWGKEKEARLLFGNGGKTSMEELDGSLKRRCEFWSRKGLQIHT